MGGVLFCSSCSPHPRAPWWPRAVGSLGIPRHCIGPFSSLIVTISRSQMWKGILDRSEVGPGAGVAIVVEHVSEGMRSSTQGGPLQTRQACSCWLHTCPHTRVHTHSHNVLSCVYTYTHVQKWSQHALMCSHTCVHTHGQHYPVCASGAASLVGRRVWGHPRDGAGVGGNAWV